MLRVPVRVTSGRPVTPAALGLIVALTPLLLLGGCMSGPKASYSDTVARVDASGTARVAVTADDRRSLITSGRESPTFVGRQWSLYHMAIVNTASGRPLADDLTSALATSLTAKGFQAIPVVVSPSESPHVAAQRITLLRVDRGVVLTVAEWRTDTRTDANFKTQLFYDLDLKVLDSSGQVLAQRRLSGHEDKISGTARDAFREKLELLMNYPEVTRALTVTESPAVEPVAPPATPPPPAAGTQPMAPPAAGTQPMAPPAAGTQPMAPPASDVATQLQKLKDLYERGLITEDVYKEKMRQILNQL